MKLKRIITTLTIVFILSLKILSKNETEIKTLEDETNTTIQACVDTCTCNNRNRYISFNRERLLIIKLAEA